MESNNEIDLWELIAKGYSFFIRKKKIIVLFFLAGIVFCLSNFFRHPLEYKSFYKKELIARSPVVSNEILFDIINALPLKMIGSPGFRNIKGTLLVNGLKETRLKVVIEIFDPQQVDSTLSLITSHIDSIDVLKEKFELAKNQNLQLLSLLKEKIAGCDSSAKQTKYTDCVALIEKKQAVERELALDKIVNFTPINPDGVLVSNTKAGVLNVLGYGFLGIVIGFIAGFISDFTNRRK